MGQDLILTFSCPDRPGLAYAVAGFVLQHSGNVLESQQYNDTVTDRFFMRVEFTVPSDDVDRIRQQFLPLAERHSMQWRLSPARQPVRAVILVSKEGHCLNDLLYRCGNGTMNMTVAAVAGNHRTLDQLSRGHGVELHHIPTPAGRKGETEDAIRHLVEETNADLVILARYMQILSPELCRDLAGRAVNIHHSFLPSFAGARPYHQAYERGVKLVGATAHYVTADLDEGPIIEQDVMRVAHHSTPAELAAAGRDVETQVLARAVRWHCEQRVLLNGLRTVVFN
ncbi:formyltetrahydrofolate deformylase [Nakamurella sp. UYEF19]